MQNLPPSSFDRNDGAQTVFGAACRYYGCVNNPDYLRIAFDFANTLLDIGSVPRADGLC